MSEGGKEGRMEQGRKEEQEEREREATRTMMRDAQADAAAAPGTLGCLNGGMATLPVGTELQ